VAWSEEPASRGIQLSNSPARRPSSGHSCVVISLRNADPPLPVKRSATAAGLVSLGNSGAEGEQAAESRTASEMVTGRMIREMKSIELLRWCEAVELIEGVSESAKR